MDLALLTPGVVEGIVDGREGNGVSLAALTDLPMVWAEQRERLST